MKSIEEIVDECIEKNISLNEASQRDGFSPGYYSNLINKKHKHLKSKIKKIKPHIFEKNAKLIYPEIKRLVNMGLSTTYIAKQLKKSNPQILMVVRFFNEDEIINKLQINNNFGRAVSFKKSLGHAKGKTYEQIYGERADVMRKKRSDWLKQNNIRKFATKISKPQAILFSIVKTDFPNAELEYEVKVNNKKSIFLDIAIPDKKINIEYDGIYWHNLNKSTITMTDNNRDSFLKERGWKVYRIQSDKNLNESELKNEYNKLQLLI